jgi:ankyrin repeat protein
MAAPENAELKLNEFEERASSITSFDELKSLRDAAVSTENVYRELFARSRDSWEIPEVDDPFVFLVNTFEKSQCYKRLPPFNDDPYPRCFEPIDDKAIEKKANELQKWLESGLPSLAIVPIKSEFELSWECLTENQLRFVNWNNIFAAGGAVSGCLTPLPKDVAEATSEALRRVQRRKYLHDTFLPGSDIDLFLYGLSQEEAEQKLVEIYEAVQAVNPYEIRVFRSAHALTLVSRYPFRHIQIVLRLYNSPAEILMGFDVDSCAVGFDGKDVYTCPRTALAIATQTNVVDMSRRSPSYEMRLAKYAQRGFEVVVPGLDRGKVDPFLYEKRFEHTKGLARLLLLERFRTPEDRLRYRIEAKIKREKASGKLRNEYKIRYDMNRTLQDARNLDRAEGTDGPFVPQTEMKAASEMSNYSTVFLPWGPNWTADRIERQMRKKDKILNKIQFAPGGRVVANRRGYKIHVCAVGTMAEVIANPYPHDPPIPEDTPEELLEGTVSGPLSWLLDNPGRQQIGSFHPVTDDNWMDEAFISSSALQLIEVVLDNDGTKLKDLLDAADDATTMLSKRDFMGRTALHFCALLRNDSSNDAAEAILAHSGLDGALLNARLANGRTALHLAAMRGNVAFVQKFLDARERLAKRLCEDKVDDNEAMEKALLDIVDIDGSDWEHKLSPLHYAVVMGHQNVVEVLLKRAFKANARKVAVHKDRNESLSLIALLALYASECGADEIETVARHALAMLLEAGSSIAQVDKTNSTIWHRFVADDSDGATGALEMFLDATSNVDTRALDLLDDQGRTALYIATCHGNTRAVSALLGAGASSVFTQDEWDQRRRQLEASSGKQLYFRGEHQEFYRCPIAAAAKAADGPSLEVFLKLRPDLANVIVDLSTTNQQSNFGGMMQMSPVDPLQRHSRNRQADPGNQDMRRKPLDLLSETFKASMKFSRDKNHEGLVRQGKRVRKRVEMVKATRDSSEDGSYKKRVWEVVSLMEEEAVLVHEKREKAISLSASESEKEHNAFAQIETAKAILQNAGGENLQQENNDEENRDPESKRGRFVEQPVILPDPFGHFVELKAFDFGERVAGHCNKYRYGLQNQQSCTSMSQSEKSCALQLMCAVATGNKNQVQDLFNVVPIACADMLNATPFSVAVQVRNMYLIRSLFEKASEQFQRFESSEKQRLLGEAGKEKVLDPETTQDTLNCQLRHLNNMDITSGTGPTERRGKNPDQIRLELERAEAAATSQLTGTGGKKEAISPVSPAALLLQRSLVLGEGKIAGFKAVLTDRCVCGCEWASKNEPVLLQPMEFAIIQQDVELLKLLIGLALSIPEKAGGKTESSKDLDDGPADVMVVDNSAFEERGDRMCTAGLVGEDLMPLAPAVSSEPAEACHDDDEEDFRGDGQDKYDEGVNCDDADVYPAEEYGDADAYPEEEYGEENTYREEEYGEEDDYAEDYDEQNFRSDLEGYEIEEDVRKAKSKIKFITRSQLRYLLTGQGSQSPSFGNMSLIQMAIAVDNVEIMCIVLDYAKHFALPRGAIGLWKIEVDEMLSKSFIDEKEKKAQIHQTNLILGRGSYVDWHNQCGYWAGEHRRSTGAVYPTLLQTALALGAANVAIALMDGVLNDACLRCVFEDSKSGLKVTGPFTSFKFALGADAALAFLKDQMKYKPIADELVRRLIGPAAVDSLGRSALFYAPASLISKTVEAATKNVEQSKFLDAIPKDVKISPLLAAICANQIDRVEALLEAGCSWSKPCPPNNWGALHMAIKCKDAILADSVSAGVKEDRWERVRKMMDLVLSKVLPEDALNALNGPPEAEHSPLMLALQSGADHKMISFFLEKAKGADNLVSAKDYDLNSLLHQLVQALAGASRSNAFPKKNDTVVESVKTLLAVKDAPSGVLAPNTENASGLTPSDIVLDVASFVWNRSPNAGRHNHRHNSMRSEFDLDRQRCGRGQLPTPVKDPTAAKDDYKLYVREVTDKLALKEGNEKRPRYVATLSEIQGAREKLKKRGEEGQQLQPKGPPMVLSGR